MASEIQIAKLKSVVAAAQASMAKWGVPASVSLAQWTIESAWGTSELALKAHNCFGVKAMHLDQPETYEEFRTHEYVSGKLLLVEAQFERYYDDADSFSDHGRLLATARRYRPAMDQKAHPLAFAVQLQLCGYSTSPKYGDSLVRAIQMYSLTQYDFFPWPDQPAAGDSPKKETREAA